jgi:hypothetical protein
MARPKMALNRLNSIGDINNLGRRAQGVGNFARSYASSAGKLISTSSNSASSIGASGHRCHGSAARRRGS